MRARVLSTRVPHAIAAATDHLLYNNAGSFSVSVLAVWEGDCYGLGRCVGIVGWIVICIVEGVGLSIPAIVCTCLCPDL